MARAPHEGTPRESRSKAYVYPPRKRTVLWASLVVGVVLVATLIGGYAIGTLVGGRAAATRRTLSPGDLASHHARIDLKCAQCHDAGKQVEALRCERCHDPSGSERLSHSAHVLLGSGDARKAETAEMTQCATCHMEHKGLTASLRTVDDRECSSCHAFSTLSRHPEFAVTRAKATPGVGIKFNHDFHLLEVQRTRGVTCQACHTLKTDNTGFNPISFDRHCASCHPFKETDPVQAENLLPVVKGSDPVSVAPYLPEPFKSATKAKLQVDGRDAVGSQLQHRDGWILFNALRMRASIDFDGLDAERLTLRSRIAYLQQLQAVRPVHEATPEELQAAVTELQGEIADIDARLAPVSGGDVDALQEALGSAQTLAKLLAATNDGAKTDADKIAAGSVAPDKKAPPPDKDAQARFDRRKKELLTALDAIAQRTADDGVKQRAAALKADVQKLTSPATSNDADVPTLLDRLTNLDDTLATVRAIPDPGVLAEVAQIDLLRSYGQQGVGMGLSANDFEMRRSELLDLLNRIEQRGGPNVRVRIAPLRQRVLSLRPGAAGDRELLRNRRQRQKQLDRVRLELELLASPTDREAPSTRNDSVDEATIRDTLQQLQVQLMQIERSPRMSTVDTPEERESLKGDLDALLSRCLKCHEYDPSGVRLAQVRAAEPVMPRSIFNHAPHITQTKCETCHDPSPPAPGQQATAAARAGKQFGVSWSNLATDVNVPGVANCQMCHKPSQAKSACETCHVYHPSSPAKLLAVTR